MPRTKSTYRPKDESVQTIRDALLRAAKSLNVEALDQLVDERADDDDVIAAIRGAGYDVSDESMALLVAALDEPLDDETLALLAASEEQAGVSLALAKAVLDNVGDAPIDSYESNAYAVRCHEMVGGARERHVLRLQTMIDILKDQKL